MLLQVRGQGFRCFESVEFSPSAGINVLIGENAVGKTTLLELIYLLHRGRSFRTNRLATLRRRMDADSGNVGKITAGWMETDGGKKVGFSVQANDTLQIRSPRTGNLTRSDLLDIHAVQLCTPDSHLLVEGGPGERRRFLDWGLFHVEHRYRKHWRDYVRLLKQRNTCLRAGDYRQGRIWEPAILEQAHMIDRARSEYVEAIKPIFSSVLAELFGKALITLSYQRGWPAGKELAALLDSEWSTNESPVLRSASRYGIHRADVRFVSNTNKTEALNLSRGQQKLLILAMQTAQTLLLAERRSELGITLLIDDLPSELDCNYQSRLIGMLKSLNIQVIATALDDAAGLFASTANVFHVEHGGVHQLT